MNNKGNSSIQLLKIHKQGKQQQMTTTFLQSTVLGQAPQGFGWLTCV